MSAEDLPSAPDLWHPVERLLFGRWEREWLGHVNALMGRLVDLQGVPAAEGRSWTLDEGLEAAEIRLFLDEVDARFPPAAWWRPEPA